MTRLHVLGSCGAWPEAGRACSGFLLEHDGFWVVIDLGFGTVPHLLEHCPAGVVDAVIVTHEHSDHCVDLNAMYRARFFDKNRTGTIPLYCTPGVVRRVDQLEPIGDLSEIFDIHELPANSEIGPFRLESFMLPHHVPNVGVRLSGPDGIVAYTGDTGPSPALAELGRGADLYIVEASHLGDPAGGGQQFHMTARGAGEAATEAGARRLMLTHFWPGSDRDAALEQAGERFDGEIIAAEEGLTVTL